jgi:hypothetical protein
MVGVSLPGRHFAEGVGFTVTKASSRHGDERSCGASALQRRAAGRRVWFLLKCLVVLAVVFFLASRDQPPETQGAVKPKLETAHKPATVAPREPDAFETLKKAAAQKLAYGVKEQCLKRPEDCLAVARSVGAGLSGLDKR